ncbi:MAG TPA: hypothetical protein VHJ77_01110 [Vicinamibacterales bacterium]|nr:hypothetical protein [Vicinamibacterales bacterium]
MHVKHLLVCAMATALLVPAPAIVAESDHTQHATHVAQRMGHGADALPGAVRRATEQFLDPAAAIAAGYADTQNCVSGPEEGAMGVHLVKLSLFDGTLDVDEPEALLYEPKNGRFRLVAAEYIAPAAAWQAGNPGIQPILMGHLFHLIPGPNRYGPDAFYELHVWAWKNNPRGTFSDWNPNVSCVGFEGED